MKKRYVRMKNFSIRGYQELNEIYCWISPQVLIADHEVKARMAACSPLLYSLRTARAQHALGR